MVAVICLGTGAAVPARNRDNTSLVLDDGDGLTLIDTSGSPIKRLIEAGLGPERLARVIITHEHLDHTYGYPSLLQCLWLMGRRTPLPVYALAETWRFLDRLVAAYRPASSPDGFPVERHEIIPGASPFLESAQFSMRAARGRHAVPSIGLRVEAEAGAALAYSADTAPCPAITELARGADLLLHEATFRAGAEEPANRLGHSTARQAAEVAVSAGVRRLALIHFTPAAPDDVDGLRDDAVTIFGDQVTIPTDRDRFEVA